MKDFVPLKIIRCHFEIAILQFGHFLLCFSSSVYSVAHAIVVVVIVVVIVLNITVAFRLWSSRLSALCFIALSFDRSAF